MKKIALVVPLAAAAIALAACSSGSTSSPADTGVAPASHDCTGPGGGYDSNCPGDGVGGAVATKAVESLDVDWNAQAVKAAKSYLAMGSFSKSGLIEQLESSAGEGFTHAQAVYGADHAYQ